MNAVYSFNPETQKFGMEYGGDQYYFTYDFEKYRLKNAYNAEGKLIARSYKGFRSKLGIHGGSKEAAELTQMILKAAKKVKKQYNI